MSSYTKSPEIGGISFNYFSNWKIELLQDLCRSGKYFDTLELEKYWKLVSIVANVLEKEYKAPSISHEGFNTIPYCIASGPSTDSFLVFTLAYDDRDEAYEILNDFNKKFYKDFKPILSPDIFYQSRYGWAPDLNPRVTREDNEFNLNVLIKMPCDISDDVADVIIEKYKDFIGEVKQNNIGQSPKAEVQKISGRWYKSPKVDDAQFHYYVNEYGACLEDIIYKVFESDIDALVPYSGCGCVHNGLVSIKQYYRFLSIMWNYFKEFHKGKYKMAFMSTREYNQKLDSPSLRRQGTFYTSICVFTDTIEEAEAFLKNFIKTAESDITNLVEECRVIPGTTIPGCDFGSNMVEFLFKGVGVEGIYQSDYLRLKDKFKHLLLPIDTIEPDEKALRESDNVNANIIGIIVGIIIFVLVLSLVKTS